jgi:hypothetical protein
MKRHGLQPYQYAGEEDGTTVARWLNEKNGTRDGIRVIELVQSLNRLVPRLSLREWVEKEQHGQSLDQYIAELNRVNRVLRRHAIWPMILRRSTSIGPFRKDRRVKEARGKFYCKWSFGGNPATPIVHSIVKLGELGLLSRLSQCLDCRVWFYARFAHQIFCSGACRERHFRASPEWKIGRRNYMRGYRQRERQRDKPPSV